MGNSNIETEGIMPAAINRELGVRQCPQTIKQNLLGNVPLPPHPIAGGYMERDSEITDEINSSSVAVKRYITELIAENERLNKALVKKKIAILSLNNKIKALETEIKENKPEFKVNINLGSKSDPA